MARSAAERLADHARRKVLGYVQFKLDLPPTQAEQFVLTMGFCPLPRTGHLDHEQVRRAIERAEIMAAARRGQIGTGLVLGHICFTEAGKMEVLTASCCAASNDTRGAEFPV